MSDELTLPAQASTSGSAASSAEAESPPSLSETSAGLEGGTRAVLRDAIQKVMDEIEHHEREAKRHLQQAQDLRRELRDSVAFLQAGGQVAKTADSAKASEPAKVRGRDDDKAHRAGGKKGPGGKRK